MHIAEGIMYYRQPKYFREFVCSGSDCTATCCFGWRIDWTKAEIDKVINAPNCSQELKELAENSFKPIDNNKSLVHFNHFECPLHDKDGLCRIQKELGAEYLSLTCSVYPRYNSFLIKDKYIYRGCNLSCPEIVQKLVTDEKAAELVNVPTDVSSVLLLHADKDEDFEAHPELRFRSELLEFFYELFSDKKCSIETAIVLGALAAQKLTQLIGDDQYDRIPEALKTFRKQVHNSEALSSINSIKPNYNVKFGVTDKIIESALDFRMTDVLKNENGEPDVERYLIGEAKLNEMFKERPFWFRNIVLSLILEQALPFKSKEHTVFENYRFFVAGIACLKLNAVAAAYVSDKINIQTKGHTLHFEGIGKISGLTGLISRLVFQGFSAYADVSKILDEFNISSPAYLALLVK